MPEKLEKCVKELIKQGKSEKNAWAICQASQKDGYISDKSINIKASIDDTTGFLTAPVVLARTGIQHYYGFELGLTDEKSMERIGVLRHPDEVLNIDSVASFVNLIATDDHPSTLVTTENVKNLQVGTVSGVDGNHKDGVLEGILTITDKDIIKKIKDGKVEVSVGYTSDVVESSGVYNGESYDFMQTNIRANHLAIVNAGRCGSACKITIDHKNKEKTMIVILNDIEYDVSDNQLAQAIKANNERMAKILDEKEKEMSEKEKELEEAKKDKDKAEATADALKKEKLSDEDLNKLVNDRAEIISNGKRILGDKMPECNNCPKEIKSAVIDKVMGEIDLSGKSDDYITAMYDMAVVKFDSVKKELDDSGEKFFNKDGKEMTRDSVRREHNAKMGMEV